MLSGIFAMQLISSWTKFRFTGFLSGLVNAIGSLYKGLAFSIQFLIRPFKLSIFRIILFKPYFNIRIPKFESALYRRVTHDFYSIIVITCLPFLCVKRNDHNFFDMFIYFYVLTMHLVSIVARKYAQSFHNICL